MRGRKIPPVKFDEAGFQSIESECFMFDKDKWKLVYALCTQPNDFRSVVLYIYPSYKHRLKKKELLSLASDTFFGIETEVELRKKTNTLSIVTSERVLTLAFLSVEHFTMWDCWLDAAYSKGALFYGQLVKAPTSSSAYTTINREIRIYIHDYRFAMASGRPLRLIGFWMISEIGEIDFFPDQLQFTPNQNAESDYGKIAIQKCESDYGYGYSNTYKRFYEPDDNLYQIVCWQIDKLKEAFQAAKLGQLRALLSRKSESGHWLNGEDKHPKADTELRDLEAAKAVKHFNQRYEAAYYNDSEALIAMRRSIDVKQERDSDETLPGILKPYSHENNRTRREPTISEASSDNPETVQAEVECYVNVKPEPSLRKISSFSTGCAVRPMAIAETSRALTSSEQSFQQFNDVTSPLQSCRESATSLPALSGRPSFTRAGSWPKAGYELFRAMRSNGTDSYTCLQSERSQNELYPQIEASSPLWPSSGAVKEVKGKYVKQTFRSSRTAVRGTRSFRDKKCLRRCHQRSMSAAIEPVVEHSPSTREENWDRAKKIIGSSTRRSSDRSTTTLQSSSLDRLATSPSNLYLNGMSKEGLEREASGEKVSRLDLSVNVENTGLPSTSNTEQKASPIPGLVKLPREKFNLKKDSLSFAKNLRRLVTGSYSKYDGERTTHVYNPQSKESGSGPNGLEAAIDKARFIATQRRKSEIQDHGGNGWHGGYRIQHSSSAVERIRRDVNLSGSSRVVRRHTVSGRAEDSVCDFQLDSYPPTTPGKLETDSTVVPPPVPERTYKKRLKSNAASSTSQVRDLPSNIELRKVSDGGTSYMMVNEAADQFLGNLREESDKTQAPSVDESSKKRTFGIHFHRKNSYGETASRRSKASIIKRVFL